MPDKGHLLNRRVWLLFERAGFNTKPNSSNTSEEEVDLPGGKKRTLDLSASDPTLGVKIIGWNKSKRQISESMTVHINDNYTLLAPTQANAGLLISTEKEFTKEDHAYAKGKKQTLWNKEELEYYESLVDAIGTYAKYEIIHSLGIETNEETKVFNVLAIHLHQPYNSSQSELYLFTAPPRLLLKTCVVLRKAQGNKDAYQRILQKKRLSKIASFVKLEDSLLPPNIIVYLGDYVQWQQIPIPSKDSAERNITLTRCHDYEIGILSIPEKYASLELIDGQHRLFGFCSTDAATLDNYNLVVLGITKIDGKKRTDTFISINDNAKRVDPNLVAYLKYNEDEVLCQKDNELMAIKVVISLNLISPFKKRVRIIDTGKERITLKGFAGYDLKGLLGPKGLLREYYKNESYEYVRALRLYFNIIKSRFSVQWDDPDKYIIFTNRGISAFLKLLRSILKTEKKQLTESMVRKYINILRDKLVDNRWLTASLASSYVGSKGWKDFHRDLVKVIQEKYKNFKE